MNRLRSRLPQGTLAKARLVTAVVACVNLAGQLPQIGSIAHGVVWHAMSRTAVVAIVIIVVATYRRRRTLWFDPVVLPVLLVMAGSGLVDSVNTTGLCIGVMIAQSLYGSHRAWLIRAAGAVLALPLAVVLSPFALDRPVEWNSATVLAIVPQLILIAVVLRAMCVAMIRQEQASARESVLARTGRRLLGAAGLDHARAIATDAISALAATSPGIVLAVLVRRGDEAEMVASAGFNEPVNGLRVDSAELSALAASGNATGPGMGALDRGAGHARRWRASILQANDIDLFLVAGAAGAVRTDFFDAFLNLSHQVALAESSCMLNSRLHHQANHDQLTGLPTRGLLLQRLARAVDTPESVVALLNIDLDDFKTVNDTYGHATGDDLLVEVAARLQEAAGTNSMTARFGGDEFAVLLTNLTDTQEAATIAERVCRRVVEPIALGVATVTVGASVGMVVNERGHSAEELLRCADLAMYSAKARGKNCVERFSPDAHGSLALHRRLDDHVAPVA